jgi:hypothetical protein
MYDQFQVNTKITVSIGKRKQHNLLFFYEDKKAMKDGK